MNMFGKLGGFMMNHQDQIEFVFAVIAIALGVFLIGRAVRANRKKRELLSQINETVTQINTAVNNINDKQNSVVYIDNRACDETRLRDGENTEQKQQDILIKASLSEAADQTKASAGDTSTDQTKAECRENLEKEAEQQQVAAVRKYFSRDCTVSKTGKSYTFEELSGQIRE